MWKRPGDSFSKNTYEETKSGAVTKMKQFTLKTIRAIMYIFLCLYFTDHKPRRLFECIDELLQIIAWVANNVI